MSSTSDKILLNSEPSFSIIKEIAALKVTLPIHQKKIQLYLDSNCRETQEMIENCVALHVALSLIEFVLQQCGQMGYWLKDHYFPSDNIIFKKEIIPAEEQIDEILQVVREPNNWPPIIFVDNKKIRSMLHERKNVTSTAYGLYVIGGEKDDLYMNSQLIRQAIKAPQHLQASYSIMIGIKYLHELAHFVYARYGRQYLLKVLGIPLKQSVNTPIGVLRGESGNRFEEQMIGFILSHAGHASIPMDVKMCLAHSSIDDHLRIISNEFINKLLQKETYDVSPEKHNFLHYDDFVFSALLRYCFDKAADVRAFHVHDDFLQQNSIQELSFTDDEGHSQNEDDNLKDVQPFHFISDKIIL